MSFQPGARLGPYEIQAAIGSGGMGEVYKALDTRLGRSVAIKVLPAQFALDPTRRERFEREARAIATLAHPHICVVHDVGHQDGFDFLVMEYLEGEALAGRLAKGPLPFDQVVRQGIEIADALNSAHKHGIVHRDLKPGNIVLTKAGAKLLDFGLAKLRPEGERGGEPAISETPTRTNRLTEAGTILGTVQYMAPEQLEGREADARADLWALGCVLYEMTTGRPAFEGRSQASLIGAILRDEPAPITQRQPLTPPIFDRLVRSCLRKDPDERWQSAHDIRVQLEALASGAAAEKTAVNQRTSAWRGRKAAWTVAALSLMVTAAVLLWVSGRTPPSRDFPLVRFAIPLPKHTTLSAVFGGMLALSPDGRRIAYLIQLPGEPSRLHVRSLEDPEPRALPQTDGAGQPFWSPDGRAIAFATSRTLQRVDLAGGPPRVICPLPGGHRYISGAWGSRGVILFGSGRMLFRVEAEGGDPTPVLSESDAGVSLTRPRFLPDGDQFLYYRRASGSEADETFVGSLNQPTKSVKLLDVPAIYTKVPGSLLAQRGTTLLTYPFDSASLEITGKPTVVVDDLGFSFDATGDGVLAYTPLTIHGLTARPEEMSQLTWFDRTGRHLGSIGPPGAYGWPALSPDGSRVVVERVTSWNPIEVDLWAFDSQTSRAQRLTFSPGRESDPVWSPDGQNIAFACTREASVTLCRRPASGAGAEEVLARLEGENYPTDWSRDGHLILYSAFNMRPFVAEDIFALQVDGDPTPRELVRTQAYEHQARLSPDGKWLAYASDESGWPEVYVQRLDSTGDRRLISVKGGAQPIWRGDGKELFYLALDMKIMAVGVTSGNDLRVGDPTPLFELPYPVEPFYDLRNIYDVTPDGQRFLVKLPTAMPPPPSINVVLNWPKAAHH
jgi:serine/threonine protein kinase/Tol biopolymer transport system component